MNNSNSGTSPSTSSNSNNSSSSNNNSSSQATSTSCGNASFSPSSLNLSVTKGTTKSHVASFQATGYDGFTIYGKFTSQDINFVQNTGGLKTEGQTVDLDLYVGSGVSAGTYTGSQTIIFDPCNDHKSLPVSVTVTEPSATSFGYTLSSESVNLTVKKGQTIPAFSATSTGSTQFNLYGWPTNYGVGLGFLPASGGVLGPGSSVNFTLTAPSDAAVGTYTGTQKFQDNTTNTERNISVSITITD